jgi:hypothetical protein
MDLKLTFPDAYWARLEEIVQQAVNRTLDERMPIVVQAMEYAMAVKESRRRGDDEASGSSQKDNAQCDEFEPRSVSEDDTRDGRVDVVTSAMEESYERASGRRGSRGASSSASGESSKESAVGPVPVVTKSSSPRTKKASQRPPSPINEDASRDSACASAAAEVSNIIHTAY